MILHLLGIRRNVTRNVFNARKNVNATTCHVCVQIAHVDTLVYTHWHKLHTCWHIFQTDGHKMRCFSKITVVCFIAYLDRADSDGNNDTSILLIVTLFPDTHLFECRKCKMY